MQPPTLTLSSRRLRLAAIISTALALAAPAFAGTFVVTSGPTFSPTTDFQNTTITVQTLNDASLVRESGNTTITIPQDPGSGASIVFTANFTANPGDLASFAYSFVADSNDTRSFAYTVAGIANVGGVSQRFTSGGTITPGVNTYTGRAMAAAPFPAATSGTFTGTFSLQAFFILPRPAGTSSIPAPAAAAPGTVNLSITQGDFSLTGGTAPTPLAGQLMNISSRAVILGGAQDAIAGFIIDGTLPKRVIVRAIGPSLPSYVPTRLSDPTLSLVRVVTGSAAIPMGSNDNWKSDQEAEIQATGLAPGSDLDSAIVATLAPGSYTAQMSGVGGVNGIGLVEVYDLAVGNGSLVSNMSTRAMVQTGNNVLIGGFIVAGTTDSRIVVRATGPSMSQTVPGTLDDPTLSLHDANGTMIDFNDNWQDDANASQIPAADQPKDPKESALLRDFAPGNYTAIVRGKTGNGIGLVEFYVIQQNFGRP